jgi:hypothetical protein
LSKISNNEDVVFMHITYMTSVLISIHTIYSAYETCVSRLHRKQEKFSAEGFITNAETPVQFSMDVMPIYFI